MRDLRYSAEWQTNWTRVTRPHLVPGPLANGFFIGLFHTVHPGTKVVSTRDMGVELERRCGRGMTQRSLD
jgi:hypothetical protein